MKGNSMQAAVSFYGLCHGAKRAEARINALRMPLAVKESGLNRGPCGVRSPVDGP